MQRSLQAKISEKVATVEREISQELHQLAGRLTKNFIAFEPLLLSDEEGSIPVRVERKEAVIPVSLEREPEPTDRSNNPGNVFQPSSPESSPSQNDSLPVVEESFVIPERLGAVPADKVKPINLLQRFRAGSDSPKGKSQHNPYSAQSSVKRIFSDSSHTIRKRGRVLVVAAVLLLLGSGGFLIRDSNNQQISGGAGDSGAVASTDELGELFSNDGYKLSINLPLDVRKTLIISPGEQPSKLEKGQIFFDQTADELFYYDGEQLRPLGGSSTFVNNTIQGPTNISNSVVTNSTILNSIVQSGVTSLSGTGDQVIVSSNTEI